MKYLAKGPSIIFVLFPVTQNALFFFLFLRCFSKLARIYLVFFSPTLCTWEMSLGWMAHIKHILSMPGNYCAKGRRGAFFK